MSAAEHTVRLSRDEVADLTGTPLRKYQVAFLLKNGIPHYLDLGDWPVVLRSAIEPRPPAAAPTKWKSNKAA